MFTLFTWRGKNLRAKEHTHSERQSSWENLLETDDIDRRNNNLEPQYSLDVATTETAEMLQKLQDNLNEKEKFYLELVLLGWPVAQIARELRVSRQTLYRWRKQVQEKYAKIAGKDP